MASQLTPCPSCSRHVKVGPPSCPFCGGAVPVDVPARVAPAGRPLSRAALLFAGAAAVTACSSSTTPPKDAGVDMGQPLPAYGVRALDSGLHEDAGDDSDASADDASTGDDAATGDGGESPDGGIVAAYGGFVGDASLEPDTGHGMAAYGVFANPDGGN